ncbi:MAG: hypothetical protein M0R80_15145 [Proteobacteria bacterium]|nr:hypothetical protein [Pseudomonadota bacterium]
MLRITVRNVLMMVATLLAGVLAAGSCDSGDGSPSVASVCSASCEQFEDCAEDYFDEVYDSMGDCEDDCEDYVDEYVDEYDDCENEYLSYLECTTGLSCNDFEDDDFDDCDDQADDLEDCLDDNYGDDNNFDNVGACQDAEDAINALPCLDTPVDYSCDNYDGMDCDYTDYFDCLSDVYYCDGDTLSYDADQLQECTDIADEISSSC